MDLAHRTPEEEVAALRHELAAMRARLGTAAAEIEHLRAQLAALRRQHYGQSSERRDADITQLELRLEDLEENEAERQAAGPNPATPIGLPKPRAGRCRTTCRARPSCTSRKWCAAAAAGTSSSASART